MAIRDLIDHSTRRRSVLKALLAGAALPFPLIKIAEAQQAEPFRIVKDGMAYRRLGRTGLRVSEIALGEVPFRIGTSSSGLPSAASTTSTRPMPTTTGTANA